MSFLRHAAKDQAGNPNPLAGDVQYTFTLLDLPADAGTERLHRARLQRGRTATDVSSTECSSGPAAAAATRSTTGSRRQAEPSATGRITCIRRGVPVRLSGVDRSSERRKGGRSARCMATNTCPKAFDGNSSNEYWVKAGSLLHTDSQGNDLPDPDNVRFYLISGLSHGVGNVTSMGTVSSFSTPPAPTLPSARCWLRSINGSAPGSSRRRAASPAAPTTPW